MKFDFLGQALSRGPAMAQLAEIAQSEARKDFVRFIADNTAYTRLRFKKTDRAAEYGAGIYTYDVVLDGGVGSVEHITYQWQKDDTDDFAKLQQIFTGGFTSVFFQNVNPTLTGSFSTASGLSYTTTVGNSFSGSVLGEEIRFNHYADNKGGIWSFVIDSDTAHPILVSTWSEAVVGRKNVVLASGLAYATHTVVATYTGADPNHAPSGGTARGWLRNDTVAAASSDHALNGYVGNNVKVTELMGFGSNAEFAIQGTYSGETVYFPEHEAATCFAAEGVKVYVDGTEINFATRADAEYIAGSHVRITEGMYFKFPTPEGNAAHLLIDYQIGMDGVLHVSGKISIITGFTATGYHAMLPLGADINTVVTGLGNSKVNAADNSTYFFPAEKDNVLTFCGVNSAKPDYIFAMTVDHPFQTLRAGEPDRQQLNKFTFFWQRTTAPKLYLHPYFNAALADGDVMTFFARYAAGHITGAYNTVI